MRNSFKTVLFFWCVCICGMLHIQAKNYIVDTTLSVQQGQIEEMTRQEVFNSILNNRQKITDAVSYYHSNDVYVYAGYDWIVTGDRTKMQRGKNIILGILDIFDLIKEDPNARKQEISFFSREKFFDSMRLLREAGMMDAELKRLADIAISQIHICEERGPNNRAANYAIGALAAAQLYPKHPDVRKWRAYAEAVWDDWYVPGDSYEPSYVSHNLPRLIALGKRLGKTKELKSDRLRKVYYRYRDHISSSGLAVTPGDGEPYDQQSYVVALAAIMEVCPDPTILWALKKAYLAGNMKTGRLPEDAFEKAYPQYAQSEVKVPDVKSAIQCIFPDTYQRPDRLILAPSRQEGAPFAQFWIQDDCNMLYHGGVSDTRGDLTHYEADGVLLIADRGRYEWPAWNNTLLVSEPDAQYPFRETSGVYSGRWYRSSANLRVVRSYMPSANYVYNEHKSIPQHFALTDAKCPLGFMWGNPEAPDGKNDLLDLQEVKIEFALLPAAGERSVGKVFPGRNWFGAYEYRNVCPSDVPVDIYISGLFVAGKNGEKELISLDEITDAMAFTFIAPDSTQAFPETLLPEEDYKIVTDIETGKKVLRLTTRYGRTVLRIKLGHRFNLTDDYSRIGLSYKYVTPVEGWTRVPIQIGINKSNVQYNLRLDRQQGGILTDAHAGSKGGDSYGMVNYRAIWTPDSEWKRQMILTEEGVLLVLDEFKPGKSADGLVGGPVWHLPSAPVCGSLRSRHSVGETADWFDASIKHFPEETRAFTNRYNEESRHLFITFLSEPGFENGVQYQPRHWNTDDYAVYSKNRFRDGRIVRWLSVMIPHDTGISARKVADALKIEQDEARGYQVILRLNDSKFKVAKLCINLQPNGEWSVER